MGKGIPCVSRRAAARQIVRLERENEEGQPKHLWADAEPYKAVHSSTAFYAVSCRAGSGLELQSLLPASRNRLQIFVNSSSDKGLLLIVTERKEKLTPSKLAEA